MTEDSENMPRPAEHNDLPAVDLAVDRMAVRRVGVVVLGMHRSGTSAMTRLLSLLGCALPSTLMGAAFHNPRGHWESQRIADFNDEILALAGTQWNDWLPVNQRLPETLVWPQLIANGRQVLREEFADAPLFVLKDPRICKLASFWMELLAAENVDPVFVLPIRNPIEVAQSLTTRDAIDESRGLLFWLRYVLAAEAATRGRVRVFTEYAALLTHREAMAARLSERLGVVWPRLSVLSGAEIAEFLTPDLRHHVSDMAELSENPAISPWITQAYEVLLGWARHGEKSSDYPVLDGISRAFDAASPAFARPMLNGEQAAQRAAQAEAENAALTGEREGASQRLGEVEAELARIIGSHNSIAEEREATARRLGEVEAEFAQACADRDARVAERDHLVGELAALTEQRTRLASCLGEIEGELHQARAERDARTAERDGLVGDLAGFAGERHRSYALGLELAALQNRLADQDSALRQKQEEAAQAWSEVATAREAIAAANERNDRLEQQAAALTRSLQDSEAWVFRIAGERRQAELRENRLTGEVQRLAREMSSLRREAAALKDALAAEKSLPKHSDDGAREEAKRLRDALTELEAAHTAKGSQMEHDLVEAQGNRRMAEDRAMQAEALKVDLERKLAERFAELAELAKLLRESEAALECGQQAPGTAIANQMEHDLREAQAARTFAEDHAVQTEALKIDLEHMLAKLLHTSESELQAAQSKLTETQTRLGNRFAEIATLTRRNREQEQQTDDERLRVDWLRRVHAVIASTPRWWAMIPEKWRRPRELRRLRSKGLFDGDAYLASYPDVANEGMDPLRHYILHGMMEGRSI